MTAALESARHEWEDGHRRFARAARDAGDAEALHRQLDLVLEGLRRRLGGAFTLQELADTYDDAERWVHVAFEEHLALGWAPMLSTVTAAAFHVFSRSALDHRP